MSQDGLIVDVYEVKVLPDTVKDLVAAIYDQTGKNSISREDAMEMAVYLDRTCTCSRFPAARHSHLQDDGKSHDIKPGIKP